MNTDKKKGTAILVLAALAGVVFVEYAQDLVQWIVCAHHDWDAPDGPAGAPCGEVWKAEALLLGVLLATTAGTVGIAFAVMRGAMEPTEARRTFYALVLGAVFAAAKILAEGRGYPDITRLGVPAFVALAFVGLHIWLINTLTDAEDPRAVWMLVGVVAMAALVGLVIGLLLQTPVLWSVETNRHFAVRPAAIVAAGAAFGAALWYGPQRKPVAVLVPVVFAGLLAAGWAAFVYYPDHSKPPNGWLLAIGRGPVIALCAGHLLPGILAAAALPAFGPLGRVAHILVWFAAAGIAGISAWIVGGILFAGDAPSIAQPGAAANVAVSVLAIPAAIRLARAVLQRLAPDPT